MSSPQTTSLGDGFLMAILAGTPLLSTAAFPYVPRPISNVCFAAVGLVTLNWVVVPVARWAWLRVRAGSTRMVGPRYPRPALVEPAPPQRRR